MMAFRIAWYKINYPLAYYAAYFTIRAKAFSIPMMIHGLDTARQAMKMITAKGDGASKIEKDLYSTLELVVEMNLRGISFMNIDINKSEATKFTIHDGKILLPFTALDFPPQPLRNRWRSSESRAALYFYLSFGLFRFRSPLLAESFLLSFPPGTKMFQFPGFPKFSRVIM